MRAQSLWVEVTGRWGVYGGLVRVIKAPDAQYSGATKSYYMEIAQLARDQNTYVKALLWDMPMRVFFCDESRVEAQGQPVRDGMEQFLKAYRTANPKP